MAPALAAVLPIENLHVLHELQDELAALPDSNTAKRLLATVLHLREREWQAKQALTRAVDRADLLDAALADAREALGAMVGGG